MERQTEKEIDRERGRQRKRHIELEATKKEGQADRERVGEAEEKNGQAYGEKTEKT